MILNILKNKGQAIMMEYVVVFFVGIGAIVAMSTYIHRGLQARIHDTRDYMISETSNAHGERIASEYEPYYGNVQTIAERNSDDSIQFLEGGKTGIFRKTLNQQVDASTVSQQAAPKDAR